VEETVIAWRHKDTARRHLLPVPSARRQPGKNHPSSSSPPGGIWRLPGGTRKVSELFGGLRLVVRGFRQATVFADVSSLPFFFCFCEGKQIFGILEARRTHLESLEEC